MRALGLTLAPERERGDEPRRGRVAVPDPNRRLATDLTTVWTRQALGYLTPEERRHAKLRDHQEAVAA